MAVNLVSIVMQYLTPDMIGRIAGMLGVDRDKAQSAIGAAVPGMLAGFSHVAEQPEGAQRLADAVKQQGGGMLGSFASMMTGGGQSSFMERGSQMLSSLLGPRDDMALAGAVGNYAGVSKGASGSLLGMLAPLVMGTIAQQGGRELDGRGIAGFLAGQKDNIAAAIPSGFGKLLGGTGLLDTLGSATRAAGSAGRETARQVSDLARRPPDSASSWIWWAIPVAAIAALALYLLGSPTRETVQQGAETAQTLTVGGVDIGREMTDTIGNLRTTLTTVTDTASAQNALPMLQQIASEVDKIGNLQGQMTTAQRSALAGVISPQLKSLNELSQKVLTTPGVSDVLTPVLQPVMAKISTLAT
jgi:hypothetical protein